MNGGEYQHSYTYGLDAALELRQHFDGVGSILTQQMYFVHDGHGSVRAVTDQNGAVTDTYDYDAFGVLIHQTGATPNTTLYSGEQFDPDLYLYYNRARYLNTSSGRFWTADTYEGDSQSPLSLHRYLYAGLDPVGRIDPLGTQDTATEAEAEAIGEIIDATPFVKGAALLLFLAAQFSGGTVENPDVATPDAGRDPRYPNRMRVQLQEGLDNTFYGVAQKNTDHVGVMVLQMRSALQTLYNAASGDSATGRNAFPFNALNDWLVTSIIISSQKLGTYPPGRIFVPQKGFLNIPPIQYRGKEYRLDVDNLAGHNLRQ
jgi:RHS repeat-associated protein